MLILQNILFNTHTEQDNILCCRTSGIVSCDNLSVHMDKESIITTDTYFNYFDCYTWNKYTGCTRIKLNITIKGKALMCIYDENDSCLHSFNIDTPDIYDEVTIDLDTRCAQGLYVKIEAADLVSYEAPKAEVEANTEANTPAEETAE